MNYTLFKRATLVIVILLLTMLTSAQTIAVQEIFGELTGNGAVYYDLFDLRAGDVLYLYVESNDFDTLIAVGDINFDAVLAEDDDSGGNLNSALAFEIPADGDYSVAVTDCCNQTATGSFRLLVGLNAPDVLTGNATSTGHTIAVPFGGGQSGGDTSSGGNRAGVQEFTGRVSPETEFIFYDLYGMQAGTTIYIYAESAEIDTLVAIGDIDFNTELARDDDSGSGTNSALQYTFPQDGDYSIAVTDCCRSDVTGNFRVLLSLDTPDVLTGNAQPTGAEIAVVYEGETVTVGTTDRTAVATNCGALQARPTLSGPELTRETQNFIIHYTNSGRDAASESYVDMVETTLEEVLQIEIGEFGWPLPPIDCGEGGDGRFDVYLMETLDDGVLGYAQPGGVVGDNPSSAFVETWAAYSFLVIDNDFAGYGVAPITGVRATSAHEFHHAIQFGYDLSDPATWLYEATASWMETQVFPDHEDATPYVTDMLDTPDICVGANIEGTNRIYAEWLIIDTIARDFGPQAVVGLWETAANLEGMPVFYEWASQAGTSAQVVMARVAVRNLLLDYDLASRFRGQVRVEATINGTGTVTPTVDGVQQLGVDYVRVAVPGVYSFQIDQPNLALLVVGIASDGTARLFALGDSGTVDTTAYSFAYVIILNTDLHEDSANCTYTNWALSVSDGSGAALTPDTGEIFNAANFVPAG